MRYLLVDRIDEMKKLEWAVGTKCVTLSEDVFEHHFPGAPVYPGALLIEAMAQLGGVLLEVSLRDVMDWSPRCVLSSVKAKFREFVRPGDQLRLRAEIVSRHDDSALVRVRGEREGKRICQAEVIYVFLKIDDPRLEEGRRAYIDDLTRDTRFVE